MAFWANCTRTFESVGAISAGDLVYAAAGGKIAATGTLLIGTALDAATGDGSVIEVLPHESSSSNSSSSSSILIAPVAAKRD